MRIAFVITELYPGGAESCLVNLACYLQGAGHDIAVWQLWPEPPEDRNSLLAKLQQAEIPVHSLHCRRAWQAGWALARLRGELVQFAPDVVQSFLFHANVATAAASVGKRWKFFGGARVRQPQRSRQYLQRWSATLMRRLICVSRSVAFHCQHVEGIPSEKLLVIPNGIALPSSSAAVEQHQQQSNDARPADWRRFDLPSDARVILFVGRLTHQKGIEDCLRQADAWLTKLPQHTFVVMGEGELDAELRKAADKLAAAPRIKFIGWQPNPRDWMAIAEMLLLPAKYEGMPNVLLEAMSVGIPWVAFDVDGVRELLPAPSGSVQVANQRGDRQTLPTDEKEAAAIVEWQIVPPGDYEALTSAIVRFANNASLRRRCGEVNLQQIHQHFSLNQQLASYLKAYSDF